MIRRHLAIGLGVLSLLLAVPAQAFPGVRSGGWLQVQQRQYQPNGGDRQRHSQQRRQESDRQQYERREAPQRLSPDERRQLRQDLRDAGRDVYPQRRNQR
ncbi:MAG: hypothetical protein H6943_08060 [Zoogloeaceae bacterium]|nr:hypothetical protein [Zoogloeaceae bacterium]